MIDRSEQRRLEEIEEFDSLSEADRAWICFCLDMAERPAKNLETWGSYHKLPVRLAAADLLGSSVAVFKRDCASAAKSGYRFAADVYPDLIRAGAFVIQYGHCATYRAFKFLMERLFGGVSRPYLPSAFLALAAHPSFAGALSSDSTLIRPEEIGDALLEAQTGWGTFECVFRPTQVFPMQEQRDK